MGSSLRVFPACDLPVETTRRGGQMVIINLQKTPIDDHAALVIHGKIDDVIKLLF
jgi:mono-ADP-ribosyltransferase sirtuin 6